MTLEFVGPLAIAVIGSRRALDAVWIALAAIGIALIAPWQAGSVIDPSGVAIALLTGGCWAAYIVLGGRVSQLLTGGVAVATGMSIATLTVLPFAVAGGRLGSFAPRLYAAGIALAVLSSALPFTLEMNALRALPGRTFSILNESGAGRRGALRPRPARRASDEGAMGGRRSGDCRERRCNRDGAPVSAPRGGLRQPVDLIGEPLVKRRHR